MLFFISSAKAACLEIQAIVPSPDPRVRLPKPFILMPPVAQQCLLSLYADGANNAIAERMCYV